MTKKNSVQMTIKAASRIYSETAKNGDGSIPKGGFGSRAMRAGMKNQVPSQSKNTGGSNRGSKV